MKKNNIEKMVGIAMLAAIVVVLQFVGNFIKIGSFSVSLVLLPIVIGAALYGMVAGAILGAVFGAVVVFGYLSGNVDLLWLANPIATALVCFIKGAGAGLCSALVYNFFSTSKLKHGGKICSRLENRIKSVKFFYKHGDKIGSYLAAIVCPIVNTGIFLLAMFTIFKPQLIEVAGGTGIVYFAFIGLAGVNFLIELGVNIILAPVVINVVNAVRKH